MKLKLFTPVKEFFATLFTDIILSKVDGRYQIFDNTLYIDEVWDNCLIIGKKRYYCVEISSYSNLEKAYDTIKNTLAQYSYNDDARLYMFLVKNRFMMDYSQIADPEYKLGKESIYIFTHIEQVATDIALQFDKKPLDYLGILRAIFDIVQINEYYNDPMTFELKSNLTYDKLPYLDSMRLGFKKTLAEGVYYSARNCEMYVSNSINLMQAKVDYHSLFREDWSGYFFFYFDFCSKRIESKAAFYNKEAQRYEHNGFMRRASKDFYEQVKTVKKNELALFQSIALVDNPYVTSQAESFLGINFIKKELFKKDIVYKTPLLERDLDFDMFMPLDNIGKYVKSVHKRFDITPRRPFSMWGTDLTGNYITYSFSESASPHFGIFAPTRTGKSFFLQKIITQIHRYDTNENVRKAYRLGEDSARTRYFDIGESARKLVKDMMVNHKGQVLYYGDEVSEIKFSFTDVEMDDKGEIVEEDMDFMLSIMSMLLEVNGEEPLTAGEAAEVKKAYKYVFRNREYEGMPLTHLLTIKGFGGIVKKVYEKYPELQKNTYAKTLDIPASDEEFSFLRKPLLSDIIAYLEERKENLTVLDEIDRDIVSRAAKKLRTVETFEMFKYYSKGDIEGSDFFYMELNSLKSLGEKLFIPAFWFIFRKLYNNDVKNAIRKKRAGEYVTETYYIVEEAHNYIKLESFKGLFEVIGREAAKFKIHIGFVTQYAKDLPEAIIKSLGTKIILPSVDAKEQMEDLKYIWKDKPDYLEFFKHKSRRYTAFIDYDYGILTLKPPITKRELWLFNSEAI